MRWLCRFLGCNEFPDPPSPPDPPPVAPTYDVKVLRLGGGGDTVSEQGLRTLAADGWLPQTAVGNSLILVKVVG